MSAGNPTRFYGIALGKEKNFQMETDGLIASADSSPSVSTKSLFYTDNAAATTITDFDDGSEGQIIKVISCDSATIITTLQNGTLILKGGADYGMTVNDSITLLKSRSNWFEVARSQNNTNQVQNAWAISSRVGEAGYAGVTYNILSGTKILRIYGSGGATAAVSSLTGGTIGESFLIIGGSNGVNFTVDTGAGLCMEATNKVTIAGTAGGIAFTKLAVGQYYAIGF